MVVRAEECLRPRDAGAQGVERGEVEGGAEAGAEGARHGAAPERADGGGPAQDGGECLGEGGAAGLLDAGF